MLARNRLVLQDFNQENFSKILGQCIIQIRRLMYLWHVLHRDKTELIYKIYVTQKNQSSVGDWVRQVENDKSELGIELKGVFSGK